MNKLYLSMLLFCGALQGQNISFADPDFKALLLVTPSCAYGLGGASLDLDVDNDNEISQTEALAAYGISIQANAAINDLAGIEYFTNLTDVLVIQTSCANLPLATLPNLVNVDCYDNVLTELDLSAATQLQTVNCKNNQLTALILPNTTSMWRLICTNNQLTSLAVTFGGDPAGPAHFYANANLLTSVDLRGSFYDIDLSNNQLTSLDLTHCSSQFAIEFGGNTPLEALNIRDFHNDFDPFSVSGISIPYSTLPNLHYICADEVETAALEADIAANGATGIEVNSYCLFHPGGTYGVITGTVRFDQAGDGCDASDNPVSGCGIVGFDSNSGASMTVYSNEQGFYRLDAAVDSLDFTVMLEHPEYFAVDPWMFFYMGGFDVVEDICVSAAESHHNVTVNIVPLDDPRPGEVAHYRVVFRNIGNQTESGTVSFDYPDALMDMVSLSNSPTAQSAGHFEWNYFSLSPLETRYFEIAMQLNTPSDVPPVDLGTEIATSASVTATVDEELDNNQVTLHQTAVNSFDPNDKTCLEGEIISMDYVGNYVTYLIRFENTGTANANHVVVKDRIDPSKFDLASLVPVNGSHPFATRTFADRVEFIFENIDLPFDDANNDGYVLFKIKLLPTLQQGDSFSNSASIYFDFNLPIVTEPAVTVLSNLATQAFDTTGQAVYPNPVHDRLFLKSSANVQSIAVFDVLGKQVMSQSGNVESIDVSSLRNGIYLLKLQTADGISTHKFVKQ